MDGQTNGWLDGGWVGVRQTDSWDFLPVSRVGLGAGLAGGVRGGGEGYAEGKLSGPQMLTPSPLAEMLRGLDTPTETHPGLRA